MSRSTLDVPPVPEDLEVYRLKMWTEVHMLRQDFHTIEILEQEVVELREEVNTAKTWAQSFGVFRSLCIAVLESIRRLFP